MNDGGLISFPLHCYDVSVTYFVVDIFFFSKRRESETKNASQINKLAIDASLFCGINKGSHQPL